MANSETHGFGCKVCGERGLITHYYSGRSKVIMSHLPGCKVERMEKGNVCPVCEGEETDYNESSCVCLNEECGNQWDKGSADEMWYTP